MGALTNAEEAEVLDNEFAATRYLALYTTVPDEDGAGTEVTGGGYERQAITMSESTSGLKVNSTDLVFGPATENWGDLAGAVVLDATTSGNKKLKAEIAPAITVNSGYTFTIPAGDLIFTAD